MALSTHSSPQMPTELVSAMENDDLTDEQLREIVWIEASKLGLSFDEAIERALENSLPANPRGFDLQSHIFMLLF